MSFANKLKTVNGYGIFLFYLAEMRPVHSRPVDIIGSALNGRQWNGTKIPAVSGIVAVIALNKTVMVRNCYFLEITGGLVMG